MCENIYKKEKGAIMSMLFYRTMQLVIFYCNNQKSKCIQEKNQKGDKKRICNQLPCLFLFLDKEIKIKVKPTFVESFVIFQNTSYVEDIGIVIYD